MVFSLSFGSHHVLIIHHFILVLAVGHLQSYRLLRSGVLCPLFFQKGFSKVLFLSISKPAISFCRLLILGHTACSGKRRCLKPFNRSVHYLLGGGGGGVAKSKGKKKCPPFMNTREKNRPPHDTVGKSPPPPCFNKHAFMLLLC